MRRLAWMGVVAGLVLASLWACRGEASGGPDASGRVASEVEPAAESPSDERVAADDAAGTGEDRLQAILYFVDESGALRAERRDVPVASSPARQARRIVEALLQGPESRSLHPSLPATVGLREVYLRDEGTAYVDMDGGFRRSLSQGSQDAVLAIESITNTLAANFQDVRRVKILVEGQEVVDLGGHLDLTRPFLPDPDLVGARARSAAPGGRGAGRAAGIRGGRDSGGGGSP